MSAREVNRSGEMEVFAVVAEAGSFSAAARALGMSPSAVSKLVARLEERLSARLFVRSTRQLQMTAEGEVFLESARVALAALEEAEASVRRAERIEGTVRISSSASYAHRRLAPLMPAFLARYPEVEVELVVADRVLDLVAEPAELAVRAGPLPSSSLVARRLGQTPIRLVASPEYLASRGTPTRPEQLRDHDRLGFSYPRLQASWRYREEPAGRFRVRIDEGETLLRLALAGAGIAAVTDFVAGEDLASGRLTEVLPGVLEGSVEPFHVVFVGRGGPVPARARALIEALVEGGRI